MSIKELEFANEDDYKVARDIRLGILEREGRLPNGPDLRMLVPDGDYWPELSEKISEAGISYREISEA